MSGRHETNIGVEAWRGLAAWMVVYAHYWGFSGHDWPPLRFAHTGVDLFFVLSGFVFAPYFWGKALSPMAFAVRRFFRIYPAYVLALALYVGMKVAAGHAPLHVWQHLTFTMLQSREMVFYYNPPFWSLPAEVEFYLLLPLLAWGALRVRWGWLVLLALAIGLRLFLGHVGIKAIQNPAYILNLHLPGILVEFLLGALAWRLALRDWGWHWRAAMVLAGLAAWCALAVWFGHVGDAGVETTWLKDQMGAAAALCFALMVAGSLSLQRPASRILSKPGHLKDALSALALWSGRLSYGMYLFHMAGLQLLQSRQEVLSKYSPVGYQGVALLLTLLMACLCYFAWEEPWRRFGRGRAQRLEAHH